MNYTVRLASSAERDLKRLAGDVLRRIDAKLQSLAEDPHHAGLSSYKVPKGRGGE